MSLIVTKFGGSVFSNDASYREVAEHLRQLATEYQHVVAVVSAAKGRSDTLINLLAQDERDRLQRALKGEVKDAVFDTPNTARQLIRGEFESVDSLIDVSKGDFHKITQEEEYFPLKANSSYLSGVVLEDESYESARHLKVNEGVTIVPGYGARDPKGNIVLLGRNASDLVAAWFATLFSADLLRFYKDVEGIYDFFGTEKEKLLRKVTQSELASRGEIKVLDSRVLAVPYKGNIEIMKFGGEKPGTIIVPDTSVNNKYKWSLAA